jgi:broad specificity phosphatase PhoE
MKFLEIRRHSFRKKGGGSQLSQEGVSFARRLGASMGPFECVATSVVPRTRETAIAMGFAVDQELVTFEFSDDMYAELEANRWWEAPLPFANLAALIATKGPTWRYAHSLASLWRDIVLSLSEGASALVIGHSGEIETALVACLPNGDHASWGVPFGPCEGARLHFGGNPAHFLSVEILRAQP